MENLRAEIEKDLSFSIENDWGSVVELTTPEGQTQKFSMNEPLKKLKAAIRYFTSKEDPVTGGTIIVNQPVVTFRISSLIRIPDDSDKWFIKMPISPVVGAPMESFVFTGDRFATHGTDIGFLNVYPHRVEHNGTPEPSSS